MGHYCTHHKKPNLKMHLQFPLPFTNTCIQQIPDDTNSTFCIHCNANSGTLVNWPAIHFTIYQCLLPTCKLLVDAIALSVCIRGNNREVDIKTTRRAARAENPSRLEEIQNPRPGKPSRRYTQFEYDN